MGLLVGNRKCYVDKSWKFFKESYIHDVYVTSAPVTDTGNFFAKARCYRSLKKHEQPHFMFFRFIAKGDKTVSVLQAHCSCKAGCGGHCNHIFALLFLFNDYSCSQITEIPSDLACTSRLQTWHIPRASSVCPMPVMATHFARSITDEESGKRKGDPVRCKLYDPRSFNVHHIMNNARMKKEADYLKSMEKRPPSSYLLDFQEPSVTINTVFGDVPLGSCLAH